MMPFSTTPLAAFPSFRAALLVYWANLLVAGVMLYLRRTCATLSPLVKAGLAAHVPAAI
jgi:uncharacterized membrane protein